MKIAANRTHYLKWRLSIGDEQWSVRYHFLWQSNKDMENKYILKHHTTSTTSVLTEKMALLMIASFGTKVEEIVASVMIQNKESESMRFQNKVIIDSKHIKSVRGLDNDIVLNKMKHHFYTKKNTITLNK